MVVSLVLVMNDWMCNSVGLIIGVGWCCEFIINLIIVIVVVSNDLLVGRLV